FSWRNVPPTGRRGKHPFGEVVDGEHGFVVGFEANTGSPAGRQRLAKVSHPVRRIRRMAAIQIPRRLDQPWPAEPASTPARRGARSTRPAAPGARRVRPLPDRATRVRRRRLAALVAAVAVALVVWGAVGVVSDLGAVGPTPEP